MVTIEFLFDLRNVVWGDWIVEVCKMISDKVLIVEVWTIRISRLRMEGCKDGIAEASLVSILDIHNCLFVFEELW